MKPVVVNGELWKIETVSPVDLALIDRTGFRRLATANPINKTISISNNVAPPLLDMVILHEITHAIQVSYGYMDLLRQEVPENFWVLVEEWSAELLERHALEAITLASMALGRPVCVRGICTQ